MSHTVSLDDLYFIRSYPPSCCCKYYLEHWFFIYLQLKTVPNKCAFYSCCCAHLPKMTLPICCRKLLNSDLLNVYLWAIFKIFWLSWGHRQRSNEMGLQLCLGYGLFVVGKNIDYNRSHASWPFIEAVLQFS